MLRVLILAGALVAGGAAAWLSATMTASPVAQAAEPALALPAAEVLVAALALEPGVVLKPEDLRWQAWPEASVIEGFVVRSAQPDAVESLTGHLTRIDLAAGEPIRTEKLILTKAGFLSATLAPGKRAVAVRISAENTAGGFIVPNDRVDVLRTAMATAASGQAAMATETILRNVRVLAIDQATDNRAGGTVLGKTATLELDVSQVEIVVAGEASGQLALALRAFADNDAPPPEPPPAAVPVPAAKPAVRIFRGGAVEQVEAP